MGCSIIIPLLSLLLSPTYQQDSFKEALEFYGEIFVDHLPFYDQTEFYGFWDKEQDYGLDQRSSAESACPVGCVCNLEVLDCSYFSVSSPTLTIQRQDFTYIMPKSFPLASYPSVKEVSIMFCYNLAKIYRFVFEKFPNMEKVLITETSLKTLPAYLGSFSSLLNMDLYNNDIESIAENQFSSMANLQYLNLARNKIHHISESAFSGTSLAFLSLAANNLNFLPDAFNDVSSSLQYIGLEHNQIEVVASKALHDLQELVHLNMSNNPIRLIEHGSFSNCPSLQIIEMHATALSVLEEFTFAQIPQLLYVSLYRTSSLMKMSGKAFYDLQSLKVVLVHHCSLDTIDHQSFQQVQELEYLIIDSNELQAVPHLLLFESGFSKLTRLTLANNKISDLTYLDHDSYPIDHGTVRVKYGQIFSFSSSFASLESLEYLDLSGNQLTGLPNDLFPVLPALQHLFLSNNRLEETLIGSDALSEGCVSLTSILMGNNQLKGIPATILKPPNVRLLDLSYNLLTHVGEGSFGGLNFLQSLYLAGNSIISVENNSFPGTLTLLDMGSNEFEFLDEEQFSNMGSLVTLNLRRNSISSLPELVFANNENLQNIDLSYNKLGWIDKKVFQDCPLSGHIRLAHNDLHTIEVGTFAGKKFNEFDASYNQLSILPDDGMFNSIDGSLKIFLQGNYIEVLTTLMFSEITLLVSLDLTDNLITEIQEKAFDNIHLQKSLDLSGNPLREMASNSFFQITRSGSNSHINLANVSPFDRIQTHTFNNVAVSTLTLTPNSIKTIDTEAFFNIQIAKSLSLSNIELGFVGRSAVSGTVGDLHLEGNSIARLVREAFVDLTCENAYLSNNQISHLEKYSLPDCNSIHLDGNALPRLYKDIVSGGSYLEIFILRDNLITEIEVDAFTSFTDTLQDLDLSSNKLTHFPAGVIDNFAGLESLSLQGNVIRRLEAQTGIGSLTSLGVDGNNGRLAYYDKELLDSLALLNQTDITLPNSLDSPVTCSCSNFAAFTVLSENYRLFFSPLSTCQFQDTTFSLLNSGEDSYLVSRDKMLCEPQITLITRKRKSWVDDLPDKDKVTLTWKLRDEAMWNRDRVFCCQSDDPSPDNCIAVTQFIVKCFNDIDNSLAKEKTVPVSEEECGKEFSTTMSIPSSSSSIACTVVVEAEDLTSPNAAFAVAHPHHTASVAVNCETRDFSLQATYFDFDSDFEDFQNSGAESRVSEPTYVNHVLGPFLLSDDEQLDVSKWFTVNEKVKNILLEDVCLGEVSGGIYSWFARNWYPLDDLIESVDDMDRVIDLIPHNLYFTVRLSFSLLLEDSTQGITIGGPDEIWVFANGELILELSSPGSCARVTIAATDASVQLGALDLGVDAAERCILSEDVASSAIELTVDRTYPLDIFLTQRTSLSSSFYLKLEGISPQADPPPRYRVTIPENRPPGGLIAELSLENYQAITGPFSVAITSGSEFCLVASDSAEVAEDYPVPDANVNVGDGIPEYYDCSVVSPTFPPLTNTPTTEIELGSTMLRIIQRRSLEYDNPDPDPHDILVSFTITFQSNALEYSFTTSIMLTLGDINDNCPVFEHTAVEPILYQTDYSLSLTGNQITVQDTDSMENKELEYFIGDIVRPDDEANYTSQSDYYRGEDISVDYLVTVHVADKGENRRGASTQVAVSISTGCIRNIQFDISPTGVFRVVSPGWMVSGYKSSVCESCTAGYRCPGTGERIKCTTCTREYENLAWTEDQPSEEPGCESPSAAEFSFGGSAVCQPCKPGWVCEEGVGLPVLEAGMYVDMCTAESCDGEVLPCPAGNECVAGVAQPCPAGTYSAQARCYPCPPGRFSQDPSSPSCSCCPPGTESSHSKTGCDYCFHTEIADSCATCRSCVDQQECPCLGEVCVFGQFLSKVQLI